RSRGRAAPGEGGTDPELRARARRRTAPPGGRVMDHGTEASRHAVAAERVRSARFVSVFRFVGISIGCALNLLVPYAIPAQAAFQSDVRLFACYWILAAGVFWATRHPRLGARLVGLD